jgi:hypothetical protein
MFPSGANDLHEFICDSLAGKALCSIKLCVHASVRLALPVLLGAGYDTFGVLGAQILFLFLFLIC